VDQLAERAVGVSELVGDLLLGPPFDEDGPEGFVAAMEGSGGVAEEVAVAGVVPHRRAPDVSFFLVGSRLFAQFMGEPVSGSREGRGLREAGSDPGKTGGTRREELQITTSLAS
jgi:hypothetical protein